MIRGDALGDGHWNDDRQHELSLNVEQPAESSLNVLDSHRTFDRDCGSMPSASGSENWRASIQREELFRSFQIWELLEAV